MAVDLANRKNENLWCFRLPLCLLRDGSSYNYVIIPEFALIGPVNTGPYAVIPGFWKQR